MMTFDEYEKKKGKVGSKEEAFERGKKVVIAYLADALHLSFGYQFPLDFTTKVEALGRLEKKRERTEKHFLIRRIK